MSAEPTAIVAAFDFDGTLTKSDSVVPFVRLVAGTPTLLLRLCARVHRLVPALARRDRDQVKAIVTDATFRGTSPAEITKLAAEHGAAILASGLRPDTTARLGWHVEQGHRVVIVSASYEHYVHVVGEQLGVDGVVATRLDVGPDGRYTGRIDGPNCRAAEKVHRLDAWLAEQGLSRDRIVLWAYGDSGGDRQLLEAAEHPVWVHDPLDSVAASV